MDLILLLPGDRSWQRDVPTPAAWLNCLPLMATGR